VSNKKIHVHPQPCHDEYDHHLPFHGYVYSGNLDYLRQLLNLIDSKDSITLVSNGEPNTRQLIVHSWLKSLLPVNIEHRGPRYTGPDRLFYQQSWLVSDKRKHAVEHLIDFYRTNYLDLIPITSGESTKFTGYQINNKSRWYHFGSNMPEGQDDKSLELNYLMRPVFDDVIEHYQNLLATHDITQYNITDNLILRLNHYDHARRSYQSKYLSPHVDTSIFTSWIYTSHPGAQLLTFPYKQLPIHSLYDQNSQYLTIPGLDYCDLTQTMTEATWHEVRAEASNEHRVSLIAFLKAH
jgi:hypothetical protein